MAVVLALVLAAGAGESELAANSNASGSCPVTLPNRTVPRGSGFTAAGFNYGNAYLRAHLYWPHGTLTAGILPNGGAMAIVNPDGSIWAKLGWWRGVRGKLVIAGHRRDKSASPLRADIPYGYGDRGFQATALTFPSVGCWQIVGKVGRARLTFVVKVIKVKKRASLSKAEANGLAPCAASPVHYSKPRKATVKGIPWLAALPKERNVLAFLFYMGSAPFRGMQPSHGVISTHGRTRSGETKILWWLPRGSRHLTLVGRQLDGTGSFTQQFDRALGPTPQYPSTPIVPSAGCWRITVRSAQTSATIVVRAIDV